MCVTDIVMDQSVWNIERVVLILPGCDWDGGFVAA